MLEALIFVVFPFCMVFAAISDMLSMTIANRVPVLLVAVFALVAPLTGMDWATYGWHFAAGGLVLAVTFGLFALGGMGGGDAKLLAATAVWMGLQHPSRRISRGLGIHWWRADARHPRLSEFAACRLHQPQPVPTPFRRRDEPAFPMASRLALAACSPIRTRR